MNKGVPITPKRGLMPVVFEMETNDPDDFMTLLWLADHPDVELIGVVVTPGSRDQCQLVRWGLDVCGKSETPIGAFNGMEWWQTDKGSLARVSPFHYRAYGEEILQHPTGEIQAGPALLAELLRQAHVSVLVGSPPKNLGRAFDLFPEITLARWVQQGGFAGDNLVAAPLDKFKGRVTCPSFNPGGAAKETLDLLASPRIGRRHFVSKNVCHGVQWTTEMQNEMKLRLSLHPTTETRTGLRRMTAALESYLEGKGSGKTMHDLVAAAYLLDDSVCEFKEVQIYRSKGDWGAMAQVGTNTWISTGFNNDRFLNVLAR